MTHTLLAVASPFFGLSFPEFLITVVIVAAVVAVVFAALHEFGIAVPAFVVRVFWILVVACLAVFAIRLLLSL